MDIKGCQGLCLPIGNTKVGRACTFSLPSFITCPGATPWCFRHCYAWRIERLRPHCRRAYQRNLELSLAREDFVAGVLERLPEKAPFMRVHVGGDFYSIAYIDAWRRIVEARPETGFWCYTRSWTREELLPALTRLRGLPNIQLFASVDPEMPLAPPGWRTAYVVGDGRAEGLPCRHQQGAARSCLDCGYCLNGNRGNVVFQLH